MPSNLQAVNKETSHTSGSTGIPKPLFVTNAILSSYTRIMNLPPTPGHDSTCARLLHGRSLILSPPFHVSFYATSGALLR
jgi:hypothetical protein